jgi:hypothetical protein
VQVTAKMSGKRKLVAWAFVVLAIGGALTAVLLTPSRKQQLKPLSLQGAVIRLDSDTNKELPIADAEITEAHDLAAGDCRSDSAGFFRLTLRKGIKPGQPVTLRFRHPEYQPLDLNEVAGDKIYVAHMVPIPRQAQPELNRPEVTVANVVVRYSLKATTAANIASAVRTFQVVNTGNVACNGREPCSPDGKWRAAIGSTSLDAGQGNEFRNARVSCIAGPCPFTQIESASPSQGGRQITVSARNWSDTATFLFEAEVVHPMISDIVRESYPVIFGQALNFTLPAGAEGVSIQAEINGSTIIFPLGPALLLTWADCNARVNSEQTKVYRCEVKPRYRLP